MEETQQLFGSDPTTWDYLLSLKHFQEQPHSPGYGYGGRIKEIREREFSRIGDITYLDHVGTTLFPQSQLESFAKDISGTVYGNPHSQNISSKLTHDTIEHVRYRILKHFNTTAEDYSVIFTSGSTAAIKLVAETFPWTSGHLNQQASCLCYLTDNHTSIVGMREVAAAMKADYVPVKPGKMLLLEQSQAPLQNESCPTSHLFCYPAQSNFSGNKFPLSWVEKIKSGKLRPTNAPGSWYVLLDAASFVSTSPLDLAAHPADFVPISFYKVFGFPTGLGALLVANKTAPLLQKTYFGGGTAAAYLAGDPLYIPKESISGRFEDGTNSFLDIIALKHGFDTLERLTGGMKNIQDHTFALASYTYSVLTTLRYANGAPVARIHSRTQFQSSDVQGPVINFIMLDQNGNLIGYTQFDKLASLHRIHIRTGCFCNAGACQFHLGISKETVKQNFQAGHVCGDELDIIDGRPTGAVRVSFGYMSTFEDAQTFLKFIVHTFVKSPSESGLHDGQPATNDRAIADLEPYHLHNGHNRRDTLNNTKPIGDTILTNGDCNHLVANGNMYSKRHVPTSGALKQTMSGTTEKGITLAHIYLYPIKSCAALEVSEWPVGRQGLLYDRNWMIVNQNGVCLSQKQEPKLCLICPSIDLARGSLVIEAQGMDPIEISLREGSVMQNHINQSKVCGARVKTFDCGERIADWLSLFLGRPCRLIQQNSDCNRNANRNEKKGPTAATLSLVNEAQYLLINTASILHLREKIPSSDRTQLEERFPLEDLIPRFRANLVVNSSRAFEEEEWAEVSVGSLRLQVLRKCTRCQIICIDQQTGERSNELLQALASCKAGKSTFGMYLQNTSLDSSVSAVISVGSEVFPALKEEGETLSAPSTVPE